MLKFNAFHYQNDRPVSPPIYAGLRLVPIPVEQVRATLTPLCLSDFTVSFMTKDFPVPAWPVKHKLWSFNIRFWANNWSWSILLRNVKTAKYD